MQWVVHVASTMFEDMDLGQRNPIQQLNATQFWRVMIDNLNFYLKFAKSLPESSTGVKKC